MMRFYYSSMGRKVLFICGGMVVAAVLGRLGWPWWAWLPAAIISAVLASFSPFFVAYLHYKLYHDRLVAKYGSPPVTTRNLRDKSR